MVVRLTSFKSGENSARFNNATESTYGILNATLSTTLEFLFVITGLYEHTIESITFDLLFANGGNYRFELKKNDSTFGQTSKEVSSMRYLLEFGGNGNSEDSNQFTLTYTITNNSSNDCDYGLYGFTISLSDTLLDLKVSFFGPLTNRTVGEIDCSVITLNKGVEAISFEKDPTKNFDSTNDLVQGRAYFRKDGIFIDGYLYGVNAIATTSDEGVVRLSESSFETDENDGGLIPPNEVGVAATPLLVFNALATAKSYTDELVGVVAENVEEIKTWLDGVEAPLVINIEEPDGSIGSLGDTLTFSKDFEQIDNKLYIKWLELT